MPFSPPVTDVHLKAISKAIWEQASVSSEKYNPRRRRITAPIAKPRNIENVVAITRPVISLPPQARAAIANA